MFANRSNFFASLACAFTSVRKDRKQPSLLAPRCDTKWIFNSTPGPSRPHTLYHAYQLEEQKHPKNVNRLYEKSPYSQAPFNIVDTVGTWSYAAPLMCPTQLTNSVRQKSGDLNQFGTAGSLVGAFVELNLGSTLGAPSDSHFAPVSLQSRTYLVKSGR